MVMPAVVLLVSTELPWFNKHTNFLGQRTEQTVILISTEGLAAGAVVALSAWTQGDRIAI